MTLPSLFRRTPFRLTLLFLALFAAAASAILAYVYVASAQEAQAQAEADVRGELQILRGVYDSRGFDALNAALIDRTLARSAYVYRLMDKDGTFITGSLSVSPFDTPPAAEEWTAFTFTDTDPDGRVIRPQVRAVQVRLAGGEGLIVGESLGDTEAYLGRLTQALWMAMGMVLLLGLGGGLLISRNLERSMGRLNAVVGSVQDGNLKARVEVRGSGDEFDELGAGLNGMLDRLETET